MTNQDYISAYQGTEKIISDFYKMKDRTGKMIELSGIVSPLKIDNRQLMAPTDNQKDSPHCAGYSATTLAESIYWKRTGILKQFDSHQVYAFAKMLDNQLLMDGTYLETSLQSAIKLCAFENSSAIQVKTFFNNHTPDVLAMTKRIIHKYDFMQAGFNIDEGWYNINQNNFYIEPYGRTLGGHAVNICGYDEEGVYVQNQWGTEWGSNGFAIMKWPTYLRELMYCAYLENAYD